MIRRADLFAGRNGAAQHLIGGNGCERAVDVILVQEVRIGAGALRDDDVADVDIGVDGTGRADAHDVLHADKKNRCEWIGSDGKCHLPSCLNL